MKYDKEYSTMKTVQNRLHKDILNKKFTGVCAGIAKFYDFPVLAVRLITVFSLIIMPVVTSVAYITASILLPDSQYD